LESLNLSKYMDIAGADEPSGLFLRITIKE
jgi:hypothetical protein